MNKFNYFIFISVQIFVILILLVVLQNKYHSIRTIINPLKERVLLKGTSSKFEFFYELQPNFNQEESILGVSDKKAQYTINSDSLNETKEYTSLKNPETLRIATLGDSFTFGLFVDTKNNYPEKLEENLSKLNCENYNKAEVINLGVYGYDLQYSVERYRIRGKKYNPDLLIWLVKDDDFTQIEELMQPEIRRFKKLGYPNFDEEKKQYTAVLKAEESIRKKYSDEKILKMQSGYISSLRNYYQNKIVFILLNPYPKYVSLINDFITKDKKSFLYIPSNLEEGKLKFIDGHLNEQGYTILVADLIKFFLEKKILSCS